MTLQGRVHGKAEVLKCLISYHDSLTSECAKETSRAARLALWDYQVSCTLPFVMLVCGGADWRCGGYMLRPEP
jgi:hypothetical protein